MNTSLYRFALPLFCLFASQLPAQQPAPAPAPGISQSLIYVRVTPGRGDEFVQLMRETSMMVAKMRVDSGEIISWTLLRAVTPGGQEARADYLISTLSSGAPIEPMSTEVFEAALKKSGSTVAPKDFYERRKAVSQHVTTELWSIEQRVGTLKKGHYVLVNSMKAADEEAYGKFEADVWRPIAESWIRDGNMSGWLHSTRILPAGSDFGFNDITVDMYPSWAAMFASRDFQATFAKVHPTLKFDETVNKLDSLRTMTRRELWFVSERVEKTK